MKKSLRLHAVSMIFATLLLIGSISLMLPSITFASPDSMTFTTGQNIQFSSTTEMSFASNVSMRFGTGIRAQFIEMFNGNGVLEPCDVIHVVWPPQLIMEPCSWWEVLDPLGNPTGVEFHIDQQYGPYEFHIDMVWPGPFPLPIPGGVNLAEKKIDVIEPCDYYVVHWPAHWYPIPCSWWEIINPETGIPSGYEFHVDWNNESCEFHVDEVIPGPYILPFPWYEIEARQKITQIRPCDYYTVIDPQGFAPNPCSWWEIILQGALTGLEFHIDSYNPGTSMFHVDQVRPDPLKIPIPPAYPTVARKKISSITPCTKFRVDDLSTTPEPCTWWKVTSPSIGDAEFHVDDSNSQNGTFHVDQVYPGPSIPINPPVPIITAEKKIQQIGPCDWFNVVDPPSPWVPSVCSWWRIVTPVEWAGVKFHVDANDQVSKFHIDSADTLPLGPTPPPWNVTAESFDPWYWKPACPDYAPSGVPDFDQRQAGTYMWQDQFGAWSHCGPVAVANSLWWLDSEFEPSPIPPPIVNDHYPLVRSYSPQWDDHDRLNVQPLVEHLAYLMDTDGRRTGLAHSGTNVYDMEAGLAHYLSWTGVNPMGDVNGDSEVNATDLNIVNLAMGSVPGAPNWDLAADVFPASMTYPPIADNIIDTNDLNLVMMNMGLKGLFYEHTYMQPDFDYIRAEVEKCQDVVLLVGYWVYNQGTWYREPGGHYVTVAGVNSMETKIAISDPVVDAFENGLIPEGRIPVPHVHMPPEPPYITHNDAALVSQDIYSVAQIFPMWPPCPGGNYELVNFASWRPSPPFFAVIESAVVTSPLGIHDVAVTNVTTSKTGCLPMETVGKSMTCRINVTVENQGDFVETFGVTAFAGIDVIGSQLVTLGSGSSTVVTFIWDTTSYSFGNRTISAQADTVTGETDTLDNTFTDGVIRVCLVGDVNGDTKVDLKDVYAVGKAFGTTRHGPNPPGRVYSPNLDINDDDKVDLKDYYATTKNFGKTEP